MFEHENAKRLKQDLKKNYFVLGCIVNGVFIQFVIAQGRRLVLLERKGASASSKIVTSYAAKGDECAGSSQVSKRERELKQMQ